MAALARPHWETVTPQMRSLLQELGSSSFMDDFYLAGGTAMALRLGHRRSIDLDFFTAADVLGPQGRARIVEFLAAHQPGTVEDVDGNLLVQMEDDLHVAFLSYGYPLLSPLDHIEGVAIASLMDGAAMKLDAVVGRGSRKDFIDLYVVQQHIALDVLLEQCATKYPYARDFPLMAVESLVLFDNADRDVQPEMLLELSWAEVRRHFVAEGQRLARLWFHGE